MYRAGPWTIATLCLLLLSFLSPPLEGVDPGAAIRAAPEKRLKAAILFNFAKYVEWPAGSFTDSSAPLSIGILGDDPFGDELDAIVAGRTIHGHSVTVKRGRTWDGLGNCHVLYISASEDERLPSLLPRLGEHPILTVGESAGFLRDGGIIRMFVDESRVRFEVNLGASTRAGLKLSSQMLQLARSVKGGQAKEE